MITRDNYAQDRNRASYYWQAEANGIIIANEHGAGSADVPLKVVGLILQDPDGPLHGAFLNTTAKTLTMHAVSYRGGDSPSYTIEIEPLQCFIWKHAVVQTHGLFGSTGNTFEALIFGRILQDMSEQIMCVRWDGATFETDNEKSCYDALISI